MASKYKRKGTSKFIQIEGWVFKCDAWRATTPNERAAYLQIKWAYNGTNNGRLAVSIRDLADALHIGKNAAANSLKGLQEKGFVACLTKGAFSVKCQRASEWLLTEYKCDVTGELSRKTFMRWTPDEKTTVPLQVRTVPLQVHSNPERMRKCA